MKDTLEQRLQHIVQVEKKIIAGSLKKALSFAQVSNLLPDPDGELVQMLARLSTAEREQMEALISQEELRIERATITKQLLTFLKDLKTRIGKELEEGWPEGEEEDPSLPDYEGKPQILILYATEDQASWEQLKKHLFLSLQDEALQFVDIHSAVPLAAADTVKYQGQLVDAAKVVLSLVTPNMLTFPLYQLAEQALVAGKLIPVRVEEIEVKDTPFRMDIKGLPADGQFVNQWANANSAWVDVAKNLRAFFEKLKTEDAS
jgi:hypothetical protein